MHSGWRLGLWRTFSAGGRGTTARVVPGVVAWRLAIIALLSSVLFFASGPSATLPQASAAQEPTIGQPSDGRDLFAAGEVVVRWRSGASTPLLQAASASVAEDIEKGAVNLLRVPSGHERETAAALSANSSVLWAHPNYVRRIQATPNDARFPEQWGVQKIQAPLAWDTATGARSVVVAVLDTGVDLTHPDLQGRLVQGRNMLNPGALPQDDSGHGTHAAGTIAAIMNNGFGIAGVASGVSIMPVKVLEADGSGTDNHVAAGIRWAADNGAGVINMSFGGPEPSDLVDEALAYATARGVMVVVAAGNEGSSGLRYPAATDPSIAVTATTETDRRASFSNFGSWVDLGAPGVNILSTSWSAGMSTYRAASGTSMAAPHVSGVIGLLLSVQPDLTIAEIDAILRGTADPVAGGGVGAGRLNAARAVAALTQPSAATSSTGTAPAVTSGTPAAGNQPLDLSRLLLLRISSRS